MAAAYLLLVGCMIISGGLACFLPFCYFNDQPYLIGEDIETHEDCKHCYCDITGVHCPKIICEEPKCEDVDVDFHAGCCPRCREAPPASTPRPGCFYKGAWYEEGEAVKGTTKCEQCDCIGGEVSCIQDVRCPTVVNCADPVVPEGKCCKECPGGCLYNWEWFDAGDVVNEDADFNRTCLGNNSYICSDDSC